MSSDTIDLKYIEEHKDGIDNISPDGETILMLYLKDLYEVTDETFKVIEILSSNIGKQDKTGSTALLYYIKCSSSLDLNVIKALKNEINIADDCGKTPLMMAAYYKLSFITEDILDELNENIGKQDNKGFTALMEIMKKTSVNKLNSIIEKLKPEIGKQTKTGTTALMLACLFNIISPEIIELLKDEIYLRDNIGRTPLMALMNGRNIFGVEAKICKCIKMLSSEIGKKDVNGNTALIIYCSRQSVNIPIISCLSEEITKQNKLKKTALMVYCSNRYIKFIDTNIIIRLRNEIGMVDSRHMSALSYLYKYNSNKINNNIINLLSIEFNYSQMPYQRQFIYPPLQKIF